MQVNGKNVDAIQWLRDTGGNNAIKRFSSDLAQTPQAAATKPKLSTQDAADLRNQLSLNKMNIVPGVTATATNTAASLLSQLNSLRTPSATLTAGTNAVDFNSVKTNTAAINGGNNTVDFRSPTGLAQKNTVAVTGDNNVIRGYNGGQTNNTITVTGNTNRMYAGQNVSNTTANLKGGGNTVNLGENASNNTIAVTGNNVKVEIGGEGLTAGSNQNWNINVAANNIQVSIVNGKATVNMADELKSQYKVTIDDATKSVSVVGV